MSSHDSQLRAVRWLAPSTADLRAVVDILAKKRGSNRWSQYFFDGRETSAAAPDAVLKFHPRMLTTISHFRVCERSPQIWKIDLDLVRRYEPASVNALAQWLGQAPLDGVRQLYLNLFLSEVVGDSTEIDMRYGDFSVSVRSRAMNDQQRVTIEIGQFGSAASLEQRYRFFVETISSLDLEEAVRITMDGGEIYVKGLTPWKIDLNGAGSNGSNPNSFHISPLRNFADAWTHVRRLTNTVSATRILNIDMAVDVTPPAYEALRNELNALASDWTVTLYGSYAAGIDPYESDASQSPDGRFPVMSWDPEDHDDLFYQADIIPTAAGRYLEIFSNCGDIAKLLKEAKSATGQSFAAVV
jgi:hypothetical protein